jgi:hypothetical protein
VSPELEHIWSRVQAQLALVVDEPTYRIWLEPLRAVELSGERLLLEAPAHASGWISERFGGVIQTSVQLVLGPGACVELTSAVSPTPQRRGDVRGRASAGGRASARPLTPRSDPSATPS